MSEEKKQIDASTEVSLELACPVCGFLMLPEHAHNRCPECGWRDTCCEGAPQ